MHTEDQAKATWCPLMRVSPDVVSERNCLASGCMAWRWAPPETDTEWAGEASQLLNDIDLGSRPIGEGWTLQYRVDDRTSRSRPCWVRPKQGRGFCGIAGRPEIK